MSASSASSMADIATNRCLVLTGTEHRSGRVELPPGD